MLFVFEVNLLMSNKNQFVIQKPWSKGHSKKTLYNLFVRFK